MPPRELGAGTPRMIGTLAHSAIACQRPRRRRGSLAAMLTLAAFAGQPMQLAAQSVRIVGTTWAQIVDLRPLRLDSVPFSATIVASGGDRTNARGQPVRCAGTSAYCHFFASGDRATASPILQDLELSGWGLGEGISAHAHLRARETLGAGDLSWPRASDRFDALDAYLNVERDRWRARLGRQWTSGALGSYNYDGVALAWRQTSWSVEGLGGASLVTGLDATHLSGDLAALDDLPPDERAWLVGARARFRPRARHALGAEYQRTIRNDRGGLYSERAAVAGSAVLAGVALDGEWTQDLLTNTVNEARLRAERSLPKGLIGSIEGRRSRPFFELWSIWGAFSPAGFDEVRGLLRRTSAGRLTAAVGGGYRRYDSTGAGLAVAPLRDDGWRVTGNLAYAPNDRLSLAGDYAIDVGPGASRSDGALRGDWVGARLSLGGMFSATQSIFEYRVGTGRLLGLGVHATYRLSQETRIGGDLAWYAHRESGSSSGTDWGQRRASVRLEWAIGRDPGAARPAVKQ